MLIYIIFCVVFNSKKEIYLALTKLLIQNPFYISETGLIKEAGS